MPRTLPWLSGKAKKASTPQKLQIEPEVAVPESDEARKISAHPEKRDFFRSSQSPPTSPIHRCPSEEYLREGLDNDDIYIMVEDEFHAVAQSFTQHLHYAEYVRKRNEAKSRNAGTIRDLSRPTDGTPMLEETRKRKEAEALSARQKAGIEQMREESEEGKLDELDDTEEDATWAGTFLYDLMTSPRRARSLVGPGAQGVRSSTRAAAGYSKPRGSRGTDGSAVLVGNEIQPHLVEDTASEDDDLDIQPNAPAPKLPRRKHGQEQRKESIGSNALNTEKSSMTTRPTEPQTKVSSMHGRYRNPSYAKSKRKMLFDDLDEFPELSNPRSPAQEQRYSSVGGTQNDLRGQSKSKKSRLNEVPTFLL